MASNLETDTNRNESFEEAPRPYSLLSGNGDNSMSIGGQDNQDKTVITEEALLHLPEELRHLLMEYKTADMELKDEIAFLRPLAEFYQQQYETQPELWMAGLRAHGLWIACSLRDPENLDYIQSAFKLMKSKLSPAQLSAMNTANKELLKQYRETHRTTLTSEVKPLLSNIDSTDWSNNLGFMTDFTSAIKDLSDNITDRMSNFFGRLIDHSVESIGRAPPCGMAAIAIGSLARCETSSYSDIEYLFLIEENSDSSVEYFRKLAFQSYYFLSMLGESNLRTYDIKELKAICFLDRCTKGLRIDGLAKKAGNQPTGNELKGSELLFTFKQLISQYRSVLLGQVRGPEKGVPSDFVDMITHRTVIWSNARGAVLYKRLEESLKTVVQTSERRVKSQQLLVTDMEEYSFLPELNHKHSGHREVKWDIYRYPSLLLTGLNNLLDIKSRTNWESIGKLVTRGSCSDETGISLSFLLASALFIRIDCYNFYQEQNDEVTLFTSEENSPQYSCPRNLFILMMSYLFPLKPLIMTELKSRTYELMIPSLQQNTFQALCITYFYCSAYDKVICEFANRYGEEMMFDQVDDFLHKVPQDQLGSLFSSLKESGSLTERHIKLLETAAKLYPTIHLDKLMAECYHDVNPSKALFHAQEQLHKTPRDDLESMFDAYLLVSQCHLEMNNFSGCEKMLNSAGTCLENMKGNIMCTQEDTLRMYGIHLDHLGTLRSKQHNYDEYLRVALEKLEVCRRFYGPGVVHGHVAHSLNDIGLAYRELNRYPESLKYYTRCLDMDYKLYGSTADNYGIATILMNIGCVHREMGQFEQSLDFLTRSYDMRCRLSSYINPTHPTITLCVGHIAGCHSDMSNYTEALQWHKQEYTNLAGTNDVNKDGLAVCTQNMGLCHKQLEDYQSAIKNYSESLNLHREINQDGKYDSIVTQICGWIASCYYKISDYTEALRWDKARYINLTEANAVDKERLAVCTYNIGVYHKQLEDYKSAIESYSESLNLFREINQDGKYNREVIEICGCIAPCHYEMSDYTEALRWFKQQYTNLTEPNVVDRGSLALCTLNMGGCHRELKDYQSAVESYIKSLKFYREINQDGRHDLKVTQICGLIGFCHYKFSDYREALRWYKQQYTNLTGVTEPKVVDRESLAICTHNMGECHRELKDYKSAVESYSNSLKLYREINKGGRHDLRVTSICGFIGFCHSRMSDYREALQWFKRIYTTLTEANVVDRERLAVCTRNIGQCHMRLDEFKAAVKNYSDSLELYREINQGGQYEGEITELLAHIQECERKLSRGTSKCVVQ